MANSIIIKTLKNWKDDETIWNGFKLGDFYIERNTSPSTDRWRTISWVDKNKNNLMYIGEARRSNGYAQAYINLFKEINNNVISNYLVLGIKNDGTTYIELASPAAWRDAIETINKQGDTIINGDGLIYKNSTLDYTQTNNGQASGTYSITMNKIVDKNNKIGMGTANYIRSDGSIELLLYAKNYNTSGNETYTNIFGIGVDKSKPYFRIGYPSQFRDALQTSRYHGSVTITNTNLVTITNSKIKANHYLVNYVISRPWNLTGQLSWTTYDGKITFKANGIAGNGIILYFDLMESEEL